MKKLTLVALAFGALSFASCKKAVTCSCTSETVDSGIDYSLDFVSAGVFQQEQENYTEATQKSTNDTELEKVSKKFQNENCPVKTVSTENYDWTDSYKTDGTLKADRTGTLLDGKKGTQTTTTTCEIK